MTPGVGLVVGEVPKLIFRGAKITFQAHIPIVFLQLPWFFRKMTSGVGLVVGEVPKLIFRGGTITFRHAFLLYSCNCHGFFEKWLLEEVWWLERSQNLFSGVGK